MGKKEEYICLDIQGSGIVQENEKLIYEANYKAKNIETNLY